MKTTLVSLALLAAPSLFLACKPLECTEIGCNDGVHIKLAGAAATLGSSMPFTVEACVDSACQSVTVSEVDGAIACDVAAGGADDVFCFVTGSDIALQLGTPVADEVSISVLIEDAAGTKLFEETTSVAIEETAPNGEACGPICRAGDVTFEPEPASQ